MSTLGEGTHGQVVLMNDHAVKRFTDGLVCTTITELVMANSLRHPYIMRAVSNNRSDTITIGMPLGRELGAMDQDEMQTHDRYRYLVHIVSALAYMHSHGVIHGDIKPQNIIIVDGSACVADFGLSVIDFGQPKTVLCTPGHRAPEVSDKGTGQYTPAVDMWAFGQVALGIITCDEQIESAPEKWRDILTACLERDPKKRMTAAAALAHPTIQEFRAEFREGLPLTTLPSTRIKAAHEKILYNWLERVQTNYCFALQTLEATKKIFEQAVATEPDISNQRLQLVGCAAMIIASSSREAYPADERAMYNVCDGCYTEDEIRNEVWAVLERLQFRALTLVAVGAADPQVQQTVV
jgi:serine/threonine protein kinase